MGYANLAKMFQELGMQMDHKYCLFPVQQNALSRIECLAALLFPAEWDSHQQNGDCMVSEIAVADILQYILHV